MSYLHTLAHFTWCAIVTISRFLRSLVNMEVGLPVGARPMFLCGAQLWWFLTFVFRVLAVASPEIRVGRSHLEGAQIVSARTKRKPEGEDEKRAKSKYINDRHRFSQAVHTRFQQC